MSVVRGIRRHSVGVFAGECFSDAGLHVLPAGCGATDGAVGIASGGFSDRPEGGIGSLAVVFLSRSAVSGV